MPYTDNDPQCQPQYQFQKAPTTEEDFERARQMVKGIGWLRTERHTPCWVNTRHGYKRSAEIWGFAGDSHNPSGYYVHYTDVGRPKLMIVVNMVEYPEGYSGYYAAQDVEFD